MLFSVKDIIRPLNKPQKIAALKVLMCKDYVLIKGYPGSGKTSLIVSLIRMLVTNRCSVLLASHTHSAVDNILLKLTQVYLQHIKLDDEDINAQLNRLLELSDYYASHYRELECVPVHSILPGLPCVAQCSLDSCWYRAEVLDVRRNEDFIEMSIIFVDYGSNDYICDATKIREIPSDHMGLPAQAMSCIISNLEPADAVTGWKPSDGALIAEVATNRVLHTIVKGVADGLVEVDLYDHEMYQDHGINTPLLYQTLIDHGLMKLTRKNDSSVNDGEDDDLGPSCSWADRTD